MHPMQRTTIRQAQPIHDHAQPARKLALQKETLRRLTPAELRLMAGGRERGVNTVETIIIITVITLG